MVMATHHAHGGARVRHHHARAISVAPEAVSIGATGEGYLLKGYPSAASIKRISDNSLKQTRTAFFRRVILQPIVRRGVYDFVLRSEVLARLQTEAPLVAGAIGEASRNALSAQSLLPAFVAKSVTCPTPGTMIPDTVLADAATVLHGIGLITVQGPGDPMKAGLLVTSGKVSFAGLSFLKDREGGGTSSNHLYWPHSSKLLDSDARNASGVTLGYGYDMKLRDKGTITNDLIGIGLEPSTAATAAAGYHRTHSDAHDFADANRDLVKLSEDQQLRLLTVIIGSYEATVRRLVQPDMALRLLVCEFDALVSMNYQGALAQPVLQPVKSHDLVAAGVAIVSATSAMYRDRRRLERALFERAVYNVGAAG